jgi:hypothetical protein
LSKTTSFLLSQIVQQKTEPKLIFLVSPKLIQP